MQLICGPLSCMASALPRFRVSFISVIMERPEGRYRPMPPPRRKRRILMLNRECKREIQRRHTPPVIIPAAMVTLYVKCLETLADPIIPRLKPRETRKKNCVAAL